MATDLKYDTKSENYSIGFQEWNLESIENYVKGFDALVKSVLKEGFELAVQEKCSAWFPIEYTTSDGMFGKPITDPDIIYVTLPLGKDEDENPRWEFNLSDLVRSMIENHESVMEENRPIDPEVRPSFIALRDHLHSLADELNLVLERK